MSQAGQGFLAHNTGKWNPSRTLQSHSAKETEITVWEAEAAGKCKTRYQRGNSCERVKRGLINNIWEITKEVTGVEDRYTDIIQPLDKEEKKKIKKRTKPQ